MADLEYYAALWAQAFPGGEPTITIGLDRAVTVTGLYPVEGLDILLQVSQDLEEWRDAATASAAVEGVLRFDSPLPAGYMRVAVREDDL